MVTYSPRWGWLSCHGGNYDYLTNSVHWAHGAHVLPNSLYLDHKPDFFGNNVWPLVDPTSAQPIHTLPAKGAE